MSKSRTIEIVKYGRNQIGVHLGIDSSSLKTGIELTKAEAQDLIKKLQKEVE